MSEETIVVEPSNSVYITNLNFRTSWHYLKDFIREHVGEVNHVDIPQTGGRSRGVAIVEFATVEDAAKAIEVLNGQILDGRDLVVKYDAKPGARRGGQRQGEPGGSIFSSGLPWSIVWRDLKDMCREYGEVTYADVFKDSERRSRGVGVVRFSSPDAAAAAIQGLNETELRGRTISVRLFEEK